MPFWYRQCWCWYLWASWCSNRTAGFSVGLYVLERGASARFQVRNPTCCSGVRTSGSGHQEPVRVLEQVRSSRIEVTQNDDEGFDCDCRARVLGGNDRCWRYRRGRKNVQKMYALP